MKPRSLLCIPFLLLDGLCALAQAEEVRAPAIAVESTRLSDAHPSAETGPFVTVVRTEGAMEEVRTLAESVAESAGVQVRSQGGLGAFSAVSIRGSSSAEVAIFLDGVPLNRGSLGTFDLSLIPLGALDRIEIYRGQTPPELSGQAMGGAINLRSRRIQGTSSSAASVSYGSFATRRVTLFRSARPSLWGYSSFLSYAGSAGDFPFRNSNGTTENSTDDFTDQRRNNGFDEIDGHVAVDRHAEGSELRIAGHAFYKDSGIPGTEHANRNAAELSTLRAGLDLQGERRRLGWDALRGSVTAYGLVERRHFRDSNQFDVGGLQDIVDWSLAGGVSGRLGLTSFSHHNLWIGPEVHVERWVDQDRLGQVGRGEAWRIATALTLADTLSLLKDVLVLEPALRMDAAFTDGPVASSVLLGQRAPLGSRTDIELSPRLGVRMRTAVPCLSVKANVGRYFRLPTFNDLYADLGYFVGRPDLRPESSLNWDAGLVCEQTWKSRRFYGEVAVFGRQSDNLIIYVPGFRYTSPVNVPGTDALGLESALQVRGRNLAATGNYTFLDLRYSDTGMQVVGRPRHEGYLRFDAEAELARQRRWVAGGYYEARVSSSMYQDPANTTAFPLRVFHAIGVKLEFLSQWTLSLEVKNLTDKTEERIDRPLSTCPQKQCPAAVSDFAGYPLPGRALFATLAWKEKP